MGFVPADNYDNEKFTLNVNPFKNGVTFQVTGYGYRDFYDEKNQLVPKASHKIVLETTIGDLFPSMLIKRHVNVKGEVTKSKGTFVDWVVKAIARAKNGTNGEFGNLILQLRNYTVRVTERTIVKGTPENTYAASVFDMDFVPSTHAPVDPAPTAESGLEPPL